MEELLEAIEHDSLVRIRKICRSGIDLTTPIDIGKEYGLEEPDETTILFYAIRKDASIEAIEVLLEFGVDIREIDQDGLSAIDVAIKFRREDVIEFCIEKGMDVNETHRKSGITPIILTACFNNINMAKLLIEHGADINSKDYAGLTVKDYAKKLGQKKMLTFLERQGAKYSLYQEEIVVDRVPKFNIENREIPSEDMGFDSI
jgi:ankyrin repeat protein